MPTTDDMIQHPDRPDEYLRVEALIVRNDPSAPSVDCCIASRYLADDSIAQADAGNVVVTFEPDDPDHMALYLAARKVSLKALAAREGTIQAARDARQQKGNA
jgi:hypothetical protein